MAVSTTKKKNETDGYRRVNSEIRTPVKIKLEDDEETSGYGNRDIQKYMAMRWY